MARRPRWFVFADDVGDPGPEGTTHFGYALIGVRSEDLRHLTEMRARSRVRSQSFHEAKAGDVESSGFQGQIERIAKLVEHSRVIAAFVSITKGRYSGPWLRDGVDSRGNRVPADLNFLRNYLVRKGLDLLFDGVAGTEATLDLVLDRVGLSDAQVLNLGRYLRGEFNQHGPFDFPAPTHVTHADSRYVEGLQVADHVAKLSHRIARVEDCEAQRALSRPFLRMQTILSAREFSLEVAAGDGWSRRARGQREAGAGDRIQVTHPRDPA